METRKRFIPFLTFHGNAEEAMHFYKSVFPDAVIHSITKYENSQYGEDGKILAGIMSIFGQTIQFLDMGAAHDCPAFSWATSFLLNCNDLDEYDQIFKNLSEGGTIMMQADDFMHYQKVSWVADKFGVTWQPVLEK